MSEGVAVQFLDYYAPLDLWTDVRASPTPDGGIAVWFRDVTTEVQSKAALTRQVAFEEQLIGLVSHDLETPLNAILLASGLLNDDPALSDDGTRSVRRIHSATEHALRMVRDLLDFTQARLGGGIRINPSPADMHALVRAVMVEVGMAFPRGQLEVRHRGDGQGAWDVNRVTQVVYNLVTNALKYSPAGTLVRVDVQGTPGDVTLLVHNARPAIPSEKLPVLFEPFERTVGQAADMGRRIGLGLYLVRQIVIAHHGTVSVSSTESEGTTFTVKLPR